MPFKPPGLYECVRDARNFYYTESLTTLIHLLYLFIRNSVSHGLPFDCQNLLFACYQLPTNSLTKKKYYYLFHFVKPKFGPYNHIDSIELDFN